MESPRRVIRRKSIIRSCRFDWPPEIKGTGPFYAVDPYVGCQHSCSYCWARSYAKKFGKQWGYPDWFMDNVEKEWQNPLVVENALELLEQDMRRLKPGRVLLSSMTDSYQPIEEKLQLTKQILLAFAKRYEDTGYLEPQWQLLILTKAEKRPLRDFGLMRVLNAQLGVTIDGMGSSAFARARMLETANHNGIKTFVSLEPWLPNMNAKKIIMNHQGYVNFWIIGSLNKSGRAVHPEFYRQELPPLIEWLDEQSIHYYVKKELRRTIGWKNEKSDIQQ